MMKAAKLFRKTGNFDGNDVLNIILEQKTTAQFITTKIYKFFVNENRTRRLLINSAPISTIQDMTSKS